MEPSAIFKPGIPVPAWVWGMHPKGSLLAHVNRRYHWHRGRLLALRSQASILRGYNQGAALRAIQEEIDLVDAEFEDWKRRYEATR